MNEENIDRLPWSGCWIWMGAVQSKGRYGAVCIDGHVFGAHRIAFEERYGPINKGLMVCHRCDVGLCVNPDHLFLGTNKDNQKDCVSKGRKNQLVGSSHKRSKITEEDVVYIRSSVKSHRALAKEFGLAEQYISDVARGIRWQHVPGIAARRR